MKRELNFENWFSVNEDYMAANQATRKTVKNCDFVEEVRCVKKYVPKANRYNPAIKYRREILSRRLIWTEKVWTVPTGGVVWSINGVDAPLSEVLNRLFKFEEDTVESRDNEVSVMETKNLLTKRTTRWLILYHDYSWYSYRGEFEMTDTNVCLFDYEC